MYIDLLVDGYFHHKKLNEEPFRFIQWVYSSPLIAGENVCFMVSDEVLCLYASILVKITLIVTLVSSAGSVLFGAVVV